MIKSLAKHHLVEAKERWRMHEIKYEATTMNEDKDDEAR
jgi:hypothetical protein